MRTADCGDKCSRKVVYDMWKQASTATWDGKARGYGLGDKEARTARLVGEGGCVSAEQSGGLSTSGDGHHLSPDEDGLPALIPEAGPPMGVLATILAEEGRAKEAEELFREGLSMYAILAQAHPEREDFRLGEEAFRESLAQLSAGV